MGTNCKSLELSSSTKDIIVLNFSSVGDPSPLRNKLILLKDLSVSPLLLVLLCCSPPIGLRDPCSYRLEPVTEHQRYLTNRNPSRSWNLILLTLWFLVKGHQENLPTKYMHFSDRRVFPLYNYQISRIPSESLNLLSSCSSGLLA